MTNPLFRSLVLPDGTQERTQAGPLDVATLDGTARKAAILLLCVIMSGAWGWAERGALARHGTISTTVVLLICVVLPLGGLVLGWATVRKKDWSPFTAPVYALLEGFVVGGVSAGADTQYHGIAAQAVAITLAMCFSLLAAYRWGLIRVTESFRRKLGAAIAGVCLFYLVTSVLAFTGVRTSSVFATGVPGILVSAVMVVIAGLTLIYDFDLVVRSAQAGLPKYMEWYVSFALVVTLIWLYFDILDLLAKARSAQQGA